MQQVMVTHKDWDDFQSVAREYGHEFVYVEVDKGYTTILNDADVVADILWAIGVVDQGADVEIAGSEKDWSYMQGVLLHETT